MKTKAVIELLKNADEAIHETYPLEDFQQSIASLAIEKINELEQKELNNDLLVMCNARRLIKAHKSTSNARLCAELFGTGHGTARDYCRKLNLDPDSNLTPFK